MNTTTHSDANPQGRSLEERMERHFDRMERETDRRSDEFRREISLRDEAFIREQALRDKALDERFLSFLSAQEERDKRLTQQFETVSREVERLGSIKSNIWGAMVTTVVILVAVGALSLTAFQAGSADRAARPGDAVPPFESPAQASPLPPSDPSPEPQAIE